MLTHKLNPICDNCSNEVSRDRSNRGLTRGANLIWIDSKTQKLKFNLVEFESVYDSKCLKTQNKTNTNDYDSTKYGGDCGWTNLN